MRVATPEGDEEREIDYYVNSIGIRFVLVPPGSFDMGEDGEGGHQQVKSYFWLGAHEVTNGEYQTFISETGYDGSADTVHEYLRHYEDWGRYASTDPEYPVVFVSWKNAQRMCKWLSKKEGVTYRLPTEAEWEFACRAGSTSAYYWGEEVRDECAWYASNGDKRTHSIGETIPNALGLYDMSGNAEEWCQSRYRPYPYSARDGREGLKASGYRVLRGGSAFGLENSIRSTERYYDNPRHPYVTYGFRLLVSPPAPRSGRLPQ